VGLSGDTPETSARVRASLSLPFALVADPAGAVLRAYGVRWPVLGLARRVTYRIGRDRRIEDVFASEWRVDEHVARACPAAPAS
jgi:peroxiredoxin Q/BCP